MRFADYAQEFLKVVFKTDSLSTCPNNHIKITTQREAVSIVLVVQLIFRFGVAVYKDVFNAIRSLGGH